MGGYVFTGVSRFIGRYVCEQLPGANSSPTVTNLSHTLGHREEVVKFWKVKVGGGRICALLNAFLVCY